MSVKNNALIVLASLALGVANASAASPVAEGLLNDYSIKEFGIAQIDDAGRCMVIVTITTFAADGSSADSIRPVCNANGDVRLYSDLAAVQGLVKRSNLLATTVVRFVRKSKTGTVGDPVAGLRSSYKAFKAEALSAGKYVDLIEKRITAGVALGWNTQVGTPEKAEYTDLQRRLVSVNEWQDYSEAKVTSLAASLVAAGVDPLTVV